MTADLQYFGGDFNLKRTLPENGIHPETRQRVYGTRAELVTGSSPMPRSFFVGDIWYRAEPEREFAITSSYEDGSLGWSEELYMLLYTKHYAYVEAEKFEISKEMQHFWTVEDGCYVQRAGNGVFRMLYCPKDIFLAEERRMQQLTDETFGEAMALQEGSQTIERGQENEPIQKLALNLKQSGGALIDIESLKDEE